MKAQETAKHRAKFCRQPIPAVSGPSSPYCEDMRRKYCRLTSFFCDCRHNVLLAKIQCIARQNSAMVRIWPFLAIFCVLYFQRAACSTFQTCILNLHYGHMMCGSMVDIHSATAENRRGKKKETTGAKYNVRICYAGRA